MTQIRRQCALCSLASSQSHRLAVLLKLGNQCVSMLDHIRILLVLIIWPGRLNDTLHSIYRARNPVASNEFRKVPRKGEC
jgi:hypothetical protein